MLHFETNFDLRRLANIYKLVGGYRLIPYNHCNQMVADQSLGQCDWILNVLICRICAVTGVLRLDVSLSQKPWSLRLK